MCNSEFGSRSRIALLKLVLVQYLLRILIKETAKSVERKAAAARIATTSFFCQNKFLCGQQARKKLI